MSVEDVSVRQAMPADLEEVLALLAYVNLPLEGVADHLGKFLLARDAAGRLVGCVGLERHGRLGLLRSAAVAPELRGSGLGSAMTKELLKRAAAEGIEEVALLTTTAREFFAGRFGFEEASRASYAERLADSPEWNLPRCSSAVFMRLNLKARRADGRSVLAGDSTA